jgi:hypothetical protein
MRGLGRLVATATACVATFGAIAALSPTTDSAAADWQRQAHIEGEYPRPNLPLLGISCPSTSLCVAVGELDTIASTTNPTGGPSAWHLAKPTGEANSDCHEHWVPPCLPAQERRVRGVSCPSAQLCIAVTGEGYIYSSTNPTGPGDAWRVADVDGNGSDTHLLDVSCPTTSLCVAVSGERETAGKVLTSTDPTGGAPAWKVTQLNESLDLRSVSCGTPTLCVAVAQQGRMLTSTNPTGSASAWTELGAPGGPRNLQGVSCAATVLCVAGNVGGNLLTSTNPTAASSWREAEGGSSVQVTGVSCLPSRQCAAVDNNGDVITSNDPTGKNGSWSRTKLIPYVEPASELEEPLNGLFGVSCVSESFCAVVGADGQIFTSTSPFAAPANSAKNTGRPKKKVKRPKITIAKLRFPSRGELREHRAHLMVRFYANGAVRRVECKVDHRRFHRCHSPSRFPIGKGTHALRIRAIGMTGLRGPSTVKRFWIGKRCFGHGSSSYCLTPGGELPPKR